MMFPGVKAKSAGPPSIEHLGISNIFAEHTGLQALLLTSRERPSFSIAHCEVV